MTIKFYSYWTPIVNPKLTELSTDEDRNDVIKYRIMKMNERTQELANELNTILGNNELISMTSSATNGIVITTIAYEDREVSEEQQ